MAFLKSLDVSASALTAQRMRMDVVAQNVANIDTTRTESGEPYRRKYVVFEERQENRSFSDILNEKLGAAGGAGVRVVEIREDESPFKLDYNPEHPDADEQGYVRKPNVELVKEMVDMMSATRSYEANITVVNGTKSMAMKALDIGR